MLGVDGMAKLGQWIRQNVATGALMEWTVEVNPEHCDRAFVDMLRALGVTRISLGVQTFDGGGLMQLGRMHDRARALRAAEAVVEGGLALCLDLIVGWPGQNDKALDRDLHEVIDVGAQHVSIYALSVEAGTPWVSLVRRGRRRLPDEDQQAGALVRCEETLAAAGYEHYEIANYCIGGAKSLHNSKYWAWADYLGLGPSAHSAQFVSATGTGRVASVVRRGNRRGLAAWLESPREVGTQERLLGEEAAREALWTGLRVIRGVDVPGFLKTFGQSRSWLEAAVARQLSLGNVEWMGERLRVSADRWLWHDGIAADLLAGP